jgi:tetratricopeptide (TPR) repeat protein
MTRWILLALAVLQQPETMSLLGQPLYAPPLPKAERGKAEQALAAAHAAYQKQPSDPSAILAFERATFAMGRVGDGLEILTHGLEAHPDHAEMLLDRGRGYILIRKFEVAERDLRKAAVSLPEAKCTLAFAQYLTGSFARARESYAGCADPGVFAYLADRRAGAPTLARPSATGPPSSTPPPLRFPGAVARAPSDERAARPLTQRYMESIERLLSGDAQGATDELKAIVEKNGKDWMQPAYIAAEADYARLYTPARPKKKKKG